MKQILVIIAALIVGLAIGYGVAKLNSPSAEILSDTIIDGMMTTGAFSGTIYKEIFQSVLVQAMEDPKRKTWTLPDENQMTAIIYPASISSDTIDDTVQP